MRWPGRSVRRSGRGPTVGVVVPAYRVEQWIAESLESLLAQSPRRWQAVVVDDGSPDGSGEIAEQYAARDPRIRVLHTENAGLGAARNFGAAHLQTDYLGFLDSDDVLMPDALTCLVGSLEATGSDFAVGSVSRWEPPPPQGRGEQVPGWVERLHAEPRQGIRIGDHPRVLGDVFAWNKLFRRSFWEEQHLTWPEGVRYEDQPTTTAAYLAGTFDVLPDVVYRWRIRADGTSITQQRSSVQDLLDRWTTKRMTLESVRRHGDPEVTRVFLDEVLPGDLWRYFEMIPEQPPDWAALLLGGVKEFWTERSLIHSALPPVHRLCGWLLEHQRYPEAASLMTWRRSLPGPVPRTADGAALDVPSSVVFTATVPAEVLAVRENE